MNHPLQLTRAEFWLLSVSAVSCVPFCWLYAENVDELLNRAPHGLTKADLTKVLLTMAEKGWLKAKFITAKDSEAYIPTANQLDSYWKEPDYLWTYCELTKTGGAVWEAFAQPRWNYFIDEGSYSADDAIQATWRLEATCLDKKYLARYFTYWLETGKKVSENTVTWTTVESWQATNWKAFPIAHRITCEYVATPEPMHFSLDYYRQEYFERHCQWLRTRWCEWK